MGAEGQGWEGEEVDGAGERPRETLGEMLAPGPPSQARWEAHGTPQSRPPAALPGGVRRCVAPPRHPP